MKRIKLFFICSFLLTTLPACMLFEKVLEMSEQGQEITATIEKKIGAKPMITYNIENGQSEIIVNFEDFTNEKITVAELKKIVRESVIEKIKKNPNLFI